MASWDDSGPAIDNAVQQGEMDSVTAAERARRLLRQLLLRQQRDDWSALPKP